MKNFEQLIRTEIERRANEFAKAQNYGPYNQVAQFGFDEGALFILPLVLKTLDDRKKILNAFDRHMPNYIPNVDEAFERFEENLLALLKGAK